MFVRRSKYLWLYEGYKAALKGMWDAIDKLTDAKKEIRVMQSQIDRQAKYIEELKRRNADGTFKAENTDFLTR